MHLRLGAQVREISPGGVALSDGTTLPADAVVVGVGITPNTSLASDSGLDVNDGVLVDASLRTSDPDIVAAGDVTDALHPGLGRHIRVEHWANALNQPAVAAATTMLGEDVTYDELPYFYTDQFDFGMEYLGHVEPGSYDRLVARGDAAAHEFIAFWLRDGRVLAGMNVNVWDITESIKALIRSGVVVDAQRLADLAVSLEDLA